MNRRSKSSKEAKRKQNRRDMPNVAEIIDLVTKLYGPVRVIGAEDYITGKKVGKLDDG